MSMSMSERTMLNDYVLEMISARACSTRKYSGTCQGAALGSSRELELSPIGSSMVPKKMTIHTVLDY